MEFHLLDLSSWMVPKWLAIGYEFFDFDLKYDIVLQATILHNLYD